MGDRLRENNLYVASVTPSSKFREDVVGKEIRESILPMVYVVVFVLITVFLGVFGTFWLRTYQRRSEIGIRMVVGADKGKVRLHMILEGLCLMSLSILPAFIVYINMLIGDVFRRLASSCFYRAYINCIGGCTDGDDINYCSGDIVARQSSSFYTAC
jgi:Predicted permease.